MPRIPPKGKPFRPGQSGNPKGRPPVPPELRKAKLEDAASFRCAVAKLLAMTNEQLSDYLKSGKANGTELMIVGQWNAARKGNTGAANFLIERSIGAVPKEIKLTGDEDQPISVVPDLSKIKIDEDTFDALATLAEKLSGAPTRRK